MCCLYIPKTGAYLFRYSYLNLCDTIILVIVSHGFVLFMQATEGAITVSDTDSSRYYGFHIFYKAGLNIVANKNQRTFFANLNIVHVKTLSPVFILSILS